MIKYVAIALLVLRFYAYTLQHLYICGDFIVTITCIQNINHNHHPFFLHFSLTQSLFLHFLYIFLISSSRLGNKKHVILIRTQLLMLLLPHDLSFLMNNNSVAFLSIFTSLSFMIDSIYFTYEINSFENNVKSSDRILSVIFFLRKSRL